MVRIPVEYQEVEYLESTGTQYIDLSLGFSDTDVIKTRFSITDTSYMDKYIVSPVKWNTDKNCFGMGVHGYLTGAYGNMSTSGTRLKPNTDNDKKMHCWNYASHVFSIDDLNISKDVSSIDFGSETENLRLFYGYNSNTQGRVSYYYHKKTDGTEINLIPCYRKSDNKPGMYDTVSGTFYVNQGTGEFLVGNNVYYDTTNLLESRRRILLTTPHLESPTPANPLTFKSNMTTKLKEGKVYFTPIQEGTGDPSPDNIRPISGWDGITVTKCGKNLLNPNDPDYANYTISPTGGPTTTSADRITTGFIPCGENVTLVASSTKKLTSSVFTFVVISAWDKNKQFISRAYVNNNSRLTFTTPEGTCYVRYSEQVTNNNNPTPSVFTKYKRQLELGSTATAYEPYTETKIAIPFPQTIYGGYVDLVNGEVVEEYTAVTLDGENVKVNRGNYSTTNFYGAGWVYAAPRGLSAKSGKIYVCDRLPTGDSSTVLHLEASWTGSLYYRIRVIPKSDYPDELTDKEVIDLTNDWLKTNPVTVAYPLETPIHHAIDPQVIRPLKGTNTIYSDANGNIEIKFWKH